MESNVVYSIPCQDCNRQYIGQTSRYITTRIKEHSRDQKPENLVKNATKTALTEHAYNNVHQFDFKNTKIIGKEPNLKKRLMLESSKIKKAKNSVNKRTDVENLNACYFYLMENG